MELLLASQIIATPYCTRSKHISYMCICYRIAGKFDEFGESSMIQQTKTIQIGTYNLLADQLICQTFFR